MPLGTRHCLTFCFLLSSALNSAVRYEDLKWTSQIFLSYCYDGKPWLLQNILHCIPDSNLCSNAAHLCIPDTMTLSQFWWYTVLIELGFSLFLIKVFISFISFNRTHIIEVKHLSIIMLLFKTVSRNANFFTQSNFSLFL